MEPHNPEVNGVSATEHDSMPDAGHEEQANRANGESSSEEKKEGE